MDYHDAEVSEIMDALQRACDARDHPYVVVYLDFDGFTQINDTQGHDAGDKILQLGARTLMNTVRSDEMIARLGGDEFVALVRADQADSMLIALRLTGALDAVGIAASAGGKPSTMRRHRCDLPTKRCTRSRRPGRAARD